MRKAVKWILIFLGGLVLLILLAGVGLSIAGTARFNKTHEVQARPVAIPTDEAELARGEHLVFAACASCHGSNLAGQPLMDDPAVAVIYAPNLTGLAETHSDDDLVLAIRHGLGRDGRQLLVMPAESFIHFSEEDLGAIIAHLKNLPRAGDDSPAPQLAPLGRILLGAGVFGDVFPAEYIDHDMPFPDRPEIGANAAYGEYFSRMCTGCHGPDLAGSQPGDPASPFAPDLTPAGGLQDWTEADFIRAMRTGLAPDGRVLDPAFMPWPSFAKLDDAELAGIWLYLQSLPAVDSQAED
jgi:mono/diheme cytochrome c family protein